MERRRTKSNDRKSSSESKLKAKPCKRSKYGNEQSEPRNNGQENKCQTNNGPVSSKPKYDFSDDSSEDEKNVTNKPVSPDSSESDLKWQGKSVYLKEMKVNLKRLNDNSRLNSTDETIPSSDFHSCASDPSNNPKEYITRNKLEVDLSSSKGNPHTVNDAQELIYNVDRHVNEYIPRNPFLGSDIDGNISPTYGDSPTEQDNIFNAVHNKNGRKLMSEESEAFFWDWILQKD